MTPPFPHARLTHEIIGAFDDVHNELRYGLLEVLYRAALRIVLEERGFHVGCEVPFVVHFHGQRIGESRDDMIVEEKVVLEIKAGATLVTGTKAQLINYVRLSGLELGLLLYFGPSAEFTRVIASGETDRCRASSNLRNLRNLRSPSGYSPA